MAGLGPGSRLGPYVLAGRLGAGGMGEVHRARDERTGQEVALKVVTAAQDLEALERFRREAELAGRVRDPRVVRVLGSGVEGTHPWIAFELVPGGSLRDRLSRDGRLAWPRAVAVARELALGLGAIHAAGLVHRDLKPENVLVGASGELKLGDFGLARRAGRKTELTRTGEVLGTPTYLSPEQARGEGEVDARSDLYSLGVVLHELLTGEAPFKGTTMTVLMAHMTAEPPSARAVAREIPEDLDALVLRLLAKDPRARPATAAEVEAALAALAPSPGPSRGALALVVLAALALLGTGLALAGKLAERPVVSPSPRAVSPLPGATSWPGNPPSPVAATQAPSPSPSANPDTATDPDVVLRLARAEHDRRHAPEARKLALRALTLAHRAGGAKVLADTYRAFAELFPATGRPPAPTAEAIAEAAVALREHLARALGRGLTVQERVEALGACGQEAGAFHSLAPESAWGLVVLGQLELETSSGDWGVGRATEALRIEPRLFDAYLLRGAAQRKRSVRAQVAGTSLDGGFDDYERAYQVALSAEEKARALDGRASLCWDYLSELQNGLSPSFRLGADGARERALQDWEAARAQASDPALRGELAAKLMIVKRSWPDDDRELLARLVECVRFERWALVGPFVDEVADRARVKGEAVAPEASWARFVTDRALSRALQGPTPEAAAKAKAEADAAEKHVADDETGDGITLGRKAVEHDWTSPNAWSVLAWAYADASDAPSGHERELLDLAEECSLNALALDPHDGVVLFRRADVLDKRGNRPETPAAEKRKLLATALEGYRASRAALVAQKHWLLGELGKRIERLESQTGEK